jgi:hypothetical protein
MPSKFVVSGLHDPEIGLLDVRDLAVSPRSAAQFMSIPQVITAYASKYADQGEMSSPVLIDRQNMETCLDNRNDHVYTNSHGCSSLGSKDGDRVSGHAHAPGGSRVRPGIR